MKRHFMPFGLTALFCACALLSISAFSAPEGFVTLFNGRNLDGWEIASLGAAWKVNDQILENHSGHSAIISSKKYHNYILVFDWRTPKDDPHENGLLLYIDRGTYTPGQKEPVRTGFFVPGPSITPNLVGRWNRTRITVEGDRCTIEVNDRVVATSDKLAGGTQPGKFGIGRDGARLDLTNIYIKELRSEKATPQGSHPSDEFIPLFNGRNLDGWKTSPDGPQIWRAKDGILSNAGAQKGSGSDVLWTAQSYEEYSLVIDWRIPNKEHAAKGVGILVYGGPPHRIVLKGNPAGEWNRAEIIVRGGAFFGKSNNTLPASAIYETGAARGAIGIEDPGFPIEFANIYIKELK